MALRPSRTVKMDTTGETYEVVLVAPKKAGRGKDAPQKLDTETGVPLWTVDVIRTTEEAEKELCSFTVPAQLEPKVTGQVVFDSPTAGAWVSGESVGSGGMYFHATAVHQATPVPAPARQVQATV